MKRSASEDIQTARQISTPEQIERRLVVLFTCCLALFISNLDNSIVIIALPSIQRSLHADLQLLQWVVGAYVLVRTCLLLSAGALADRFGRLRVFQLGLVGFGVGSVLCSIAPTAELLVAARVLQGIGGAALTPASLAIITNIFRRRGERARAIAAWNATAAASTALGPIVGGALVEAAGWRSVFWINVPVVALAYGLAASRIAESRPQTARRLDLQGQILIFAAFGSLTFALIQAPSAGWGSPTVAAMFALTAVALLGFLVVEHRKSHPLLDLSDFRNPSFAGSSALAVITYTALGGFIFLNTLYLQQVRGYSPLAAGILISPAMIGVLLISPLAAWLTGRFGTRPPATIGCLLLLAGLLILSGTTPDTSFGLLTTGYFLLGAGLGSANVPITMAAVAGMPNERAAVAGAVSSVSRQVGYVLGVTLLGSIAYTFLPARTTNSAVGVHAAGTAFTTGMHYAYLVAAALTVCGMIIALRAMGHAPRRVKLQDEPELSG